MTLKDIWNWLTGKEEPKPFRVPSDDVKSSSNKIPPPPGPGVRFVRDGAPINHKPKASAKTPPKRKAYRTESPAVYQNHYHFDLYDTDSSSRHSTNYSGGSCGGSSSSSYDSSDSSSSSSSSSCD